MFSSHISSNRQWRMPVDRDKIVKIQLSDMFYNTCTLYLCDTKMYYKVSGVELIKPHRIILIILTNKYTVLG